MTASLPQPPWAGRAYSTKRDGVSITRCDAEPVATPGCVQAHGVLLVLRPGGLEIVQASENARALLDEDADRLLGRPVASVLGDACAARLAARLEREPVGGPPFHVQAVQIDWDAPPLDVLAHRVEGAVIVELEPVAPDDLPEADHDALARRSMTRFERCDSVRALCDAVVEEVRALTGFDRVMVYRFHPDFSGEVFAEARDPGVPSWLGLRYPAEDIPRPAREIFLRTWVRPVPDVAGGLAELVPLVHPDTGAPLEMSGCALRGPSVMYTEYLANMGVKAALTMAIRRGGELWGLIACHHYAAPRRVPHRMRSACELLARVASMQHRHAEDREHMEYRLRLDAIHQRLVARVAQREGDLAALVEDEPVLTEGLAAGGLALQLGRGWRCAGATPTAAQLDALAAWLAGRLDLATPSHPVYATDCLSAEHPPAAAYAAVASGILAVPLSRGGRGLLIWFRPETVRTVSWGGDPRDRPVVDGPNGPRPTPRRSFELWGESVHRRAVPWHPVEIEAAERLRALAVDLVVAQADRLAAANAQLTAGREHLAYVLGAARVGTWEVDLEDGGVRCSEVARTIFGIAEGEPFDRWEQVERRIVEEDRPMHAAALGRALRGPVGYEVEYRVLERDGRERWVLSRGRCERDAGGRARTMSGIVVDIDDRRRSEEALRAADRRKDEFLAMLAHELRNPLAPVRTGVRLLRGGPPARTEGVLDMIDRQVVHMVRLIDDLLDVARISRGHIELRREALRVDAVVSAALEASRPVLDLGRHLVTVEPSREPVRVSGDPVRLAQVLTNLLNNAAKYTPPGGHVRVSIEPGDATVTIRVRDDGHGIPRRMLSRVFEWFERGGDGSHVQGGLGIGLPLARRLVELHGGTLVGDSEGPDRGSVFTVTLPRLDPRPGPGAT